MMLGTTNIKFIDAEQVQLAYQYKNTKRKLYKTNAAIWYNKTCRQRATQNKAVITNNSTTIGLFTTDTSDKNLRTK